MNYNHGSQESKKGCKEKGCEETGEESSEETGEESDNAKFMKELGIENIIGSFRPNEFGLFKIKHGPTDFDAYIHMVQKDGSPIDAWIRSLTRNGMKPLKTDVQAMTVFGITPEEFEELQTNYHADMWKQFGEKWECGEVGQWTVDPETGLATYQESNLWGIIPNLPDYVTLE